MGKSWHPAWTAGLALGILYVVEGLFETGILFAVWPILGGIFAAALVKWDPGARLTPGTGAKAGAGAGLVGGLVLLVVGTPIVSWLMSEVNQQPQLFGGTFDLPLVLSVLLIESIYALGGLVVATAAGAATGLLGGERGGVRREQS